MEARHQGCSFLSNVPGPLDIYLADEFLLVAHGQADEFESVSIDDVTDLSYELRVRMFWSENDEVCHC